MDLRAWKSVRIEEEYAGRWPGLQLHEVAPHRAVMGGAQLVAEVQAVGWRGGGVGDRRQQVERTFRAAPCETSPPGQGSEA